MVKLVKIIDIQLCYRIFTLLFYSYSCNDDVIIRVVALTRSMATIDVIPNGDCRSALHQRGVFKLARPVDSFANGVVLVRRIEQRR